MLSPNTNILIFPCNGHGTPAITQTITYLGMANNDVKITAISTNCDSGGATGNHLVIMQRLQKLNPEYQFNAVGDYLKLAISLLKHQITKQSDVSDVRVGRWEDVIEPKLFASNSRTPDPVKIMSQIDFFVETFDQDSMIDKFLKINNCSMENLKCFVVEYSRIYEKLRSENLLVDPSSRGQPVWFYILFDYLYNISGQNIVVVNQLWQECGFLYSNFQSRLYGDRAHTLQYTTADAKILISESQVDDRGIEVELKMDSGVILNFDSQNVTLQDPTVSNIIESCDCLIIPLGSYETVYVYLKLHQQDLNGKNVILLINSDVSPSHKIEYQCVLDLLGACNLAKLTLVGAAPGFDGLRLPPNSKSKIVSQSADKKLDTAELNTVILAILKDYQSLPKTILSEEVKAELQQARLGHLIEEWEID